MCTHFPSDDLPRPANRNASRRDGIAVAPPVEGACRSHDTGPGTHGPETTVGIQ